MEIKVLRAFIAVAEELNFRKAADKLHMTQPPLTRMISQLEYDLGARLFNRTTRSVELTGAGLHLLQKGRVVLDQMSLLELEVRSLQKTRNGKVYISFDGGALHSELPKIVSSFKEQFPKIVVTVVDTNIASMKQNLLSGRVDIFFGATTFKGQINMEQVAVSSHELGIMVAKDSRLASKTDIRLKDLYGETLIFHGKHERLGFQEEFLEYLTHKNIKPNVYYKKSNESCASLVKEKKGVLLSTKKMAMKNSNIVFVPLTDYSRQMKVFATWSAGNPSLSLKALINFIEEKSIPKSGLDMHLG